MSEHYFEFKNVCKAFDDNAVLKDVSFFVEQGETAVIMGRSGVGKSVSLKLLLGFLAPDSGRIIVAGQDVTDWTEEQFSRIRRRVTMVFQSGALFDSLTVEENIAFPLESRSEVEAPEKIDATVKELMAELEVADFRGFFAIGFEHWRRNARWRLRGRWRKIPTRFCTTSRLRWWTR